MDVPYILRSNFLPPMSMGLSMYLEMTYVSFMLIPLKATFKLAPGTIFFSWLIFFSRNMP